MYSFVRSFNWLLEHVEYIYGQSHQTINYNYMQGGASYLSWLATANSQ